MSGSLHKMGICALWHDFTCIPTYWLAITIRLLDAPKLSTKSWICISAQLSELQRCPSPSSFWEVLLDFHSMGSWRELHTDVIDGDLRWWSPGSQDPETSFPPLLLLHWVSQWVCCLSNWKDHNAVSQQHLQGRISGSPVNAKDLTAQVPHIKQWSSKHLHVSWMHSYIFVPIPVSCTF